MFALVDIIIFSLVVISHVRPRVSLRGPLMFMRRLFCGSHLFLFPAASISSRCALTIFCTIWCYDMYHELLDTCLLLTKSSCNSGPLKNNVLLKFAVQYLSIQSGVVSWEGLYIIHKSNKIRLTPYVNGFLLVYIFFIAQRELMNEYWPAKIVKIMSLSYYSPRKIKSWCFLWGFWCTCPGIFGLICPWNP